MHLRSLARFDFDSVLLPYNYPIMQNPQYAANFEKVVGILPGAKRGSADHQGDPAASLG